MKMNISKSFVVLLLFFFSCGKQQEKVILIDGKNNLNLAQ